MSKRKEDWSYGELAEQGIEVCASCGGANVNTNWKIKINSLPIDWCFNCLHNEGTMTCMPDDDVFYSKAKETFKEFKKNNTKSVCNFILRGKNTEEPKIYLWDVSERKPLGQDIDKN